MFNDLCSFQDNQIKADQLNANASKLLTFPPVSDTFRPEIHLLFDLTFTSIVLAYVVLVVPNGTTRGQTWRGRGNWRCVPCRLLNCWKSLVCYSDRHSFRCADAKKHHKDGHTASLQKLLPLCWDQFLLHCPLLPISYCILQAHTLCHVVSWHRIHLAAAMCVFA